MENKAILCNHCGIELEEIETKFQYLGHEFSHKIPRCPKCGQVFIAEELATGKISEIEMLFEEK